MELFDLPDCMLEQIFKFLSYDEIARKRIVCMRFNLVCQGLLNVGYKKLMDRIKYSREKVTHRLSSDELKWENHSMEYLYYETWLSVNTELSVLSSVYLKFIKINLCCFIPGKVIDEGLHVLNYIANASPTSLAALFKILEINFELQDISNKAINHFKEKIMPSLDKAYETSSLNESSTQSSLQRPSVKLDDPCHSNYILLERKLKNAMRKLDSVVKIQNRQSIQIKKLNEQNKDLRRRLKETNTSKKLFEEEATVVSRRATRSSSRNIDGWQVESLLH